MSDGNVGSVAHARPDGAGAPRLKTVEADELLGGAREVVIVHRGERYRLRLTQNGKLILTK